MASNLTTLDFLYKKTYPKGIGEAAMRMHPTLRDIRKEGGLVGSSYDYSVLYGNPQGVQNGELDISALNITSSYGEQFVMSSIPLKYGVVHLHGPSILAANGDGALLSLVKSQTKGVADTLGADLGFDLFRDGTGNRGQRASISTNTITLATASDTRHFRVGMELIASANADGSSPRTGAAIVASISISAGTVTVDSAAGITSFADNDYLFRITSASNGLAGFQKIVPLTAPTSGDSFRSVDRSVFVELLAGSRLDNTALTIDEAAADVAMQISLLGKSADSLRINPLNYQALANRTNAQRIYSGGGKGEVGFESLIINVAGATALKVTADPDCPMDEGRVMTMADWCIKHRGKQMIHDTGDAGAPKVQQVGNTDHAEVRNRFVGDVVCTDPAGSGVFSIAS